MGGALYGGSGHGGQSDSGLLVGFLLQDVMDLSAYYVWTHRSSRCWRHRHDHGGNEPHGGWRLSGGCQHAQRCGDNDSLHMYHQFAGGGECGEKGGDAGEHAQLRTGEEGR